MNSLADAGIASGAVVAAFAAWTRSQWPTSQVLGRTLLHGPQGRELALTFDDGPHERYTRELLEALANAGVRATFFCIGEHVRALPWLVRAVADAGHVVGNHTMTHPNLAFASRATIRKELSEGNALIEDTLGRPVRYFRPPYGGRRPAVLRVARELGLQTVMWNAMGFDWRKGRTGKQIMKSVEQSIRKNRAADRGTTILLHDGAPSKEGLPHRGGTVAATVSLLERGAAANYRFVTVDDWWGGGAEAVRQASPVA